MADKAFGFSADDVKRIKRAVHAFESGRLDLDTNRPRKQTRAALETFIVKTDETFKGATVTSTSRIDSVSGAVSLFKVGSTGDLQDTNIDETANNYTRQNFGVDEYCLAYREPVSGELMLQGLFAPTKWEVKTNGTTDYKLKQGSSTPVTCIRLVNSGGTISRTTVEEDIYAGRWFSGVAYGWGEVGTTADTGDYIDAYYDYRSNRWEAMGSQNHFIVANTTAAIPKGQYGSVTLSLGIGTAHSTTSAGSDLRVIKEQGLVDFNTVNKGQLVFGWWDWLGGGHWDIANLDTLVGCGITQTSSGALQVDAGAIAGCGLGGSGCVLELNTSDLAGPGLQWSASTTHCTINVGAGCGILVTDKHVHVVATPLCGDGLEPSTSGCAIDVNPGCGIEIVADAVAVKASDLAGNGLTPSLSGGCDLNVGAGCGIIVEANEVKVDAAALGSGGAGVIPYTDIGGTTDQCSLAILAHCGITISTGGGVAVIPEEIAGCNMVADADCSIAVDCAWIAGDGLTGTTDSCCKLAIAVPGCGLNFSSSGSLQVIAEELVGAGLTPGPDCTIDIDCSWLQANSSCFDAGNAIQAGCGINLANSSTGKTVSVDASDLAGIGLTATTAGCGLNVELIAGCGINTTGATVSLDMGALTGSGLTASTTGGCGLSIDLVAGCGINTTGNNIAVDNADLAGTGLVAGTGCSLDVNLIGGCGITASGATVSVNASALAGVGLSASTTGGCTLDVELIAGCGINTTGATVAVSAGALAGAGLSASTAGCALDVDCGWIVANCTGISSGCDSTADSISSVGGIVTGISISQTSCTVTIGYVTANLNAIKNACGAVIDLSVTGGSTSSNTINLCCSCTTGYVGLLANKASKTDARYEDGRIYIGNIVQPELPVGVWDNPTEDEQESYIEFYLKYHGIK